MDCGRLAAPANGTVTGNKTTYPNKFTFKCNAGFRLRGSSVRACQENGRWSGAKAMCQGTEFLIYNKDKGFSLQINYVVRLVVK